MKRRIKIIIICTVAFFVAGSIFNWFSNTRYLIEKRYSSKTPYLFMEGVGINYKGYPGYDEEYYFEDSDHITVDLTNQKRIAKDKFDTGIDVYLYGKYINSADPVVVVLNDEVVFNKKGKTDDLESFYEDIYLRKLFVFKLNGLYASGENKLIISTGKTSKEYSITTK